MPFLALVVVAAACSDKFLDWAAKEKPKDHFACSIAQLEDVNGDGVRDLFVGDPGAARGGGYAGAVHVLSGADGRVLRTVHGREAGTWFGVTVAAAGDVDGDGVPDVLATQSPPYWNFGSNSDFRVTPSVLVIAGASGEVVAEFRGHARTSFGIALGSTGDRDGDGCDDVWIGAPGHPHVDGFVGRITIASARRQETLGELSDGLLGGRFGSDALLFDDVNGDRVPDFAVSAPEGRYTRDERVELRCGKTGNLLHRLAWPMRSSDYQVRLRRLPDVDGDGVDELYVGNSQWTRAADGASFQVYSGKSGQLIHEVRGGRDNYGIDAVTIGDLDGDGIGDFVVAAVHCCDPKRWGSLTWLSSASGTTLAARIYEFHAAQYLSMCALDDIEGDGVTDFAVGTGRPGRLDLDRFDGQLLFVSGKSGDVLQRIAQPE